MTKSADAFRTISEVADLLNTPAHVLRFWESRFPQVKPVKRAGGRRYYRPSDVALLGGIKALLHDDGLTIRGVQKLLKDLGPRHVAAMAEDSGRREASEVFAQGSTDIDTGLAVQDVPDDLAEAQGWDDSALPPARVLPSSTSALNSADANSDDQTAGPAAQITHAQVDAGVDRAPDAPSDHMATVQTIRPVVLPPETGPEVESSDQPARDGSVYADAQPDGDEAPMMVDAHEDVQEAEVIRFMAPPTREQAKEIAKENARRAQLDLFGAPIIPSQTSEDAELDADMSFIDDEDAAEIVQSPEASPQMPSDAPIIDVRGDEDAFPEDQPEDQTPISALPPQTHPSAEEIVEATGDTEPTEMDVAVAGIDSDERPAPDQRDPVQRRPNPPAIGVYSAALRAYHAHVIAGEEQGAPARFNAMLQRAIALQQKLQARPSGLSSNES